MPRADKGLNRTPYVEAPCTGCDRTIRRRASEMRPTMFHNRQCYTDYMNKALERLNAYERLFGPLPWEKSPSVSDY